MDAVLDYFLFAWFPSPSEKELQISCRAVVNADIPVATHGNLCAFAILRPQFIAVFNFVGAGEYGIPGEPREAFSAR